MRAIVFSFAGMARSYADCIFRFLLRDYLCYPYFA